MSQLKGRRRILRRLSVRKRLHRLILDYDGMRREEVEGDASYIQRVCPRLGSYRIEKSDTPTCWRVVFPRSALSWGEAVSIARYSRCDKEWLEFCIRYGRFASKTLMSRSMQPERDYKPKNPAVEKITLPIILVVKPSTKLEVKRVIKICEAIEDKDWKWKYQTPLFTMKTEILIGCVDKSQVVRRVKFLEKSGMNLVFEVKYRFWDEVKK